MDYVEPKGYFTKEMMKVLKNGNKAEKKATSKPTSKPASSTKSANKKK